jgi:hypothetical protein
MHRRCAPSAQLRRHPRFDRSEPRRGRRSAFPLGRPVPERWERRFAARLQRTSGCPVHLARIAVWMGSQSMEKTSGWTSGCPVHPSQTAAWTDWLSILTARVWGRQRAPHPRCQAFARHLVPQLGTESSRREQSGAWGRPRRALRLRCQAFARHLVPQAETESSRRGQSASVRSYSATCRSRQSAAIVRSCAGSSANFDWASARHPVSVWRPPLRQPVRPLPQLYPKGVQPRRRIPANRSRRAARSCAVPSRLALEARPRRASSLGETKSPRGAFHCLSMRISQTHPWVWPLFRPSG